MRIPASKVLDVLIPGETVEVRTAEFRGFDAAMQYTDAVALAVRGSVEGVTNQSGKLRYLRLLSEQEMPDTVKPEAIIGDGGAYRPVNLGVFREPIRQAIVTEDPWGNRIARASGEIVGHVFTHCAHRMQART